MAHSTRKSPGRQPFKFDRLTWPVRLGLMAFVLVAYPALFIFAQPIGGRTLSSITVPVVAAIAILGGHLAWGVAAGLALVPLNIWLYSLIKVDEPLSNHIAYALYGVLFSWMVLKSLGWFRKVREQEAELAEERTQLEAEISRREFVESSLQAERDFARLVIDSLGQGLVLMNSQLRFEYVNPAYAALIGRRPEDIIGRTPLDFADPSEHARIRESLARRQRGEAHTYEMTLRHSDGHSIDTLVTVTPRRVEGEVSGSIVVVTDVSEQKRTETRLRENQIALERQARILDQTQQAARVGGWELDLRKAEMFWTAEMYRIHDVSPETFSVDPTSAVGIYAPEYQERVSSAIQRAIATGEPYDLEVEVVTHSGRRIWTRTVGHPVFEDGMPVKLYGSFQDITSQKLAEHQVRAAEAEYRSLYENVPIGLYRSTPHGEQARANPYLYRLNGFDTEAEQIAAIKNIGREWYVDPERRAQFIAAIERDGEVVNFESEVRRYATGERLWVSENARALHNAEGEIVQYEGSVIDITDRKRAELALEDQRRFATSVMEAMGQGLTVTDPAGQFVYVNQAYARMLGYEPSELIGRSPFDFTASIDHASLEAARQARARGEKTSYETSLRHRDGSLVYALITGVPRIEGGHAAGSIATITDLSERRRQEQTLQTLNEELASKNREMETFTYSVSHDLKAPLRGIDGYSRILLEDYGDRLDDEGKRFLRTIRGATIQMSQLITDLLAYSRLERRALVETPIELADLVGAIVTQRLSEIRALEPTIEVAVPQFRVLGDRDGLAQAVRNLVDNALKFARPGEAPRIEVGAERLGQIIRLSVRDHGIGFDMQYHDKIFGIFTRLHRQEDYPGTGVGLALVRKAMERMGGRAWAESQPGEGATFYLEIPEAAEAAPVKEHTS